VGIKYFQAPRASPLGCRVESDTLKTFSWTQRVIMLHLVAMLQCQPRSNCQSEILPLPVDLRA